MYASKRQAFTPRVYDTRVVLAALDYNFHRERPTYRTAEGHQVYRKKYNKNARRYSLYAIKCKKSYDYITELQTRIFQGRVTSRIGMPRKRSLRADDPRRLGVATDTATTDIRVGTYTGQQRSGISLPCCFQLGDRLRCCFADI